MVVFALSSYRHMARASGASRQETHHSHWSRRVTADNPRGFSDKVLARLRAIEDPAKREREEKKLLDQRRWSEKWRSNTDHLAHRNDRKRQQKINSGYAIVFIVLSVLCMFLLHPSTGIHSCRVPTRNKNHWSQLISDDNPRGYNEIQKQKIVDAGTLVRKRGVEIQVMMNRLQNERIVKEPIVDEYGKAHINAMIVDIKVEYENRMNAAEEDGDVSEGF
jgi:hypothetical protein